MNIWKLRKFFLTEYRWHHPSCFRAVTPAVQAAINIEIPLQPCSDTIINPWHARSSVLSGVLCQPTSLSSVFTLRCGTKVSTVGRPAFPPRKPGRYGYNCGFNWISESRTKQDFLLCFLVVGLWIILRLPDIRPSWIHPQTYLRCGQIRHRRQW